MNWADIAAIATLISLLLVLFQISLQSRQIRAQTRAYLHVGVSKLKEGKRFSVCLRVHNSGKIPARNVEIVFPAGSDWKQLRGNPVLPFEPSGEELNLWPGETVLFRLGPLDNLQSFEGRGLHVDVSYRHLIGKRRVEETVQLSLAPQSYVVSKNLF